jgi:site-specific DNA-methyltransferase (adenine-specific)
MQILIGDCREVLKSLPDKSIHCCVTSPPYYGLRDYGVEGQIGLEQSPEDYVSELVMAFREVKRVLRDDGTLWLNLGDSYWGGKGKSSQAWSTSHQDRSTLEKTQHQICGKGETRPTDGKHAVIKPKDLIGIPWRVALALQADGWYLRQDIIWSKNNPMPESVTDRCTKSHEYIFLFSKSPKYYFDNEAIKEPATSSDDRVRDRDTTKLNNTPGRTKMKGLKTNDYEFRNKRSVWNINNVPYKGAHFACFPPALVEPCIKAGCPGNGVVLDPFGGSGTVGQVCNQLGRDCVLIELNPEYKHLIEERINIKPTIKKQSKKRNEANHLSKVALQQNLLHYINQF